MDRDRREIILSEIDHWRSTRLLPEHYCDFLENLYHDNDQGKENRNSFSLANFRQGSTKIWILTFGLITFFFFILFYFSLFPWPLQIAVPLLIISLFYTAAGVVRRKGKHLAMYFAGTGSLCILGFGMWMLMLQQWNNILGTTILIAICGIIWSLVGYYLHLNILYYCGLVCGLLLYAFLIGRVYPQLNWMMLQLAWLPISVLMSWLSWLVHHRIRWKRLASVYFSLGVTAWFMPEMDAILLRQQEPGWITLLCFMKLMVGFILLFIFRKKWMVWVAS